MELLALVFLLGSLFFLSRKVTSHISLFFLQLTRSNAFSIQLLAVLFLPGVIIHELAHWLVASLLFVPTGDIEFLPQVQSDNTVKLGSVQIAQTDPFRRFFIGIAPLLFGTLVLVGIFFFLSPSLFPITWKTIVFLYVIFEIGNTMFSSKKDLEGVVGFVILAFLLVSLLFFLKVPLFSLSIEFFQLPFVRMFLEEVILFLCIAIGIDIGVVGLFLLLQKVYR